MGRVVHFEIQADDMDRAEGFYAGVFGWAVKRWEGAPFDYRLLTTGPDGVAGIDGALVERNAALPTEGQGFNAFVCTVEVDSIEETEQAVAEAGGRVVMEPAEVPQIGRLGYFLDTEGNTFAALQPA